MEPIFLAAQQDAIPELRRFVVSDGRRVVMTESLEEAAGLLEAGGAATPAGREALETQPSNGSVTGAWSAAALELLEQAEARAREGDWEGYGEAIAALRALLESLRAGGG
jgi:hypothetical protein